MFDIKEELKKLPDKPGVYIMKHDDDIIYVGKAVILKNRVRQYFQKNNKSRRIEKMVSLITNFEYIVTDSEVEALMLECNLIKLYRPKFNVMLKDDKMYPYIKITNEDYPIIYITRKILNDDAKYLGPYTDVTQVKVALDYIKKIYKIRQCRLNNKQLKKVDRPCINYQMKRCLAPCKEYVSKEEYQKNINEIIHILSGNINELISKMKEEMNEYSKKLEFEKAADIRNKIEDVKALIQRQKASNFSENDIDVIGVYKKDDNICLQIFFVRNHKLIGRENYFFNEMENEDESEVVLSFLKQYYTSDVEIPSKIMVKYEILDNSLIDYLNTKKGSKVEIRIPKKGEKLRFIEMAENNAKIALENKLIKVNKEQVCIQKLTKLLDLKSIPNRIESYDISNISGTDIVGGMIVIENFKFQKSKYRRFAIKEIYNQDDPKCMAQVLERRINEYIKGNSAFKPLPDLILVDGGITQINAVLKVIKQYNMNIDIYGMVKDNKHRTRAILDINNEEIELKDDDVKNYVTKIQDEIHNYVITYHRNKRDKKMIKSQLDNIQGIGEKKKQELLKYFGSVQKIKESSMDEISKVKGINIELAKKIKEGLE